MTNNECYHCRVCGFRNSDPPWGLDGQTPTYEICDCCGVEFGYGDTTRENVVEIRKAWIGAGANWDNPKMKPSDWNLAKQLEQVPDTFK